MATQKSPIAPWSVEGQAELASRFERDPELKTMLKEAMELGPLLQQEEKHTKLWTTPAKKFLKPEENLVDMTEFLAKVKAQFPEVPCSLIVPEAAGVSPRMLRGSTVEELRGVMSERWWRSVPENLRDAVKEKAQALRLKVLEMEELAAREEGLFALPAGDVLSDDPVLMEAQLELAKLEAVFVRGLELIEPMRELANLGFIPAGVRPKDLYKCVVEFDPNTRARALNRARVQKFRDKIALRKRKVAIAARQKTLSRKFAEKLGWDLKTTDAEHFFELSFSHVSEGVDRVFYAGSVQYEAAKGYLDGVGIENIDTIVDKIASVHAVYTWQIICKLLMAGFPEHVGFIRAMSSYREGKDLRDKLLENNDKFTRDMSFKFRAHFISVTDLADGDAFGFGENWKKSYIDVACVVFYERDKEAWNIFVAHTLNRCQERWRALLGEWAEVLDASRGYRSFIDQLEAACYL